MLLSVGMGTDMNLTQLDSAEYRYPDHLFYYSYNTMHADWVSTLLGSRGIVGYWDTYQAENATCKIASVPLETVPRRRREFARGKVKRAQRWGKKKAPQ